MVLEIKTVMFDCAVNNGSHPIYVNWHVHSQLIGINRSFAGSEGAFLSDGGAPLTLTSVTWIVLDGSMVLCTVRINFTERIDQCDPPATLTVYCKFYILFIYNM